MRQGVIFWLQSSLMVTNLVTYDRLLLTTTSAEIRGRFCKKIL